MLTVVVVASRLNRGGIHFHDLALGRHRKTDFELTCLLLSTQQPHSWYLASLSERSNREQEKYKNGSQTTYNLISDMTTHDPCHILFGRSESIITAKIKSRRLHKGINTKSQQFREPL